MNSKYYIIPGNAGEFVDYRKELCHRLHTQGTEVSYSHFVYVSSPENLRGIRNPRGWFVGTYHTRKDLEELVQMLYIIKTGEEKTPDFIKLCKKVTPYYFNP